VIERVGGAALRVYQAHRRRALEGVARDADRVQEATLLDLVNSARGTAFGRSHRFEQIRSVADYQARTPLGDYLRFQPLWTRAINGERDLTWPGRPRYWVKTSGTTAGDKTIPVTPEAFRAHRKGGWDALLIAAERSGRVCYAMELDALYVDTAIRRWQAFTGLTARLDADGKSFDELQQSSSQRAEVGHE